MTSEITFTTTQSQQLETVYDADIADILSRVVVDDYSHALEEHPNTAPLVHECMRNNGPYMQFQIFKGERYLRICIVDEEKGLIGFQIVDIVGKEAKELTAYIKDNCKCIQDVLRYVAKMRYPRFKGVL